MKKTIKTILLTLGLLTMLGFKSEAAVSVGGATYSDDMTVLQEVTDKSVTTFTVPSSVNRIWGSAFTNCTNLNKLNVSSAVYFDGNLGTNMPSLKSLVIPANSTGNPISGTAIEEVTLVGIVSNSLRLTNCTTLKTINFTEGAMIPSNSTEDSGGDLFISNCQSLRTVNMPAFKNATYYKPFISKCNNVVVNYDGSKITWLAGGRPGNDTCTNVTKVDTYVYPINLEIGVVGNNEVGYSGYIVWVNGTGFDTKTMSSSNTSVATTSSDGKVTCVSVGKTIITVTASNNSNSVSKQVELTVYPKGSINEDGTVKTGVTEPTNPTDSNTSKPSLAVTRTTLAKGDRGQIVINNQAGATSYKSSNKSIATVSSSGVVKAKKVGKATITVKNNGTTMKLTVTVKGKPNLNKTEVTLGKGQDFTVKVSNLDNKSVKYSTSNKKIATVNSSGKITAKKAGKTTIKIKADGVTVKCTITVVNASINQKKVTITKGTTTNLEITNMPSDTSIKWVSSNKKVAKVSKDGTVTGIKKGTVTITGKCNNKVYTCKVKVQ